MGNQVCVSKRDKKKKMSRLQKELLLDIERRKEELMRGPSYFFQGPNFSDTQPNNSIQ